MITRNARAVVEHGQPMLQTNVGVGLRCVKRKCMHACTNDDKLPSLCLPPPHALAKSSLQSVSTGKKADTTHGAKRLRPSTQISPQKPTVETVEAPIKFDNATHKT